MAEITPIILETKSINSKDLFGIIKCKISKIIEVDIKVKIATIEFLLKNMYKPTNVI
tara:strand:+ start:47 stop:217 length:171 start_codon:yes stop_codon:yes gene_type:complete